MYWNYWAGKFTSPTRPDIVYSVGLRSDYIVYLRDLLANPIHGSVMLFGWFRSKGARDQSRLIKKDREHLEARARRFLTSFLKADENGKPQFYKVVEDAVQRCQADAGVGQPSTELEDEQLARATSAEAIKILLALENNEAGSNATFIIDAYATVAIAYHRAAGVYSEDNPMQELGTAAVHLLTMATSYTTQRTDS